MPKDLTRSVSQSALTSKNAGLRFTATRVTRPRFITILFPMALLCVYRTAYHPALKTMERSKSGGEEHRGIVMSCPHHSRLKSYRGSKPKDFSVGIAAVAAQMSKFESKLRLIVSYFAQEKIHMQPWCEALQISYRLKVKIECFEIPVGFPSGYGIPKSRLWPTVLSLPRVMHPLLR
jgi:hypothetical protein